jgi:prepilin-type N-terminal cleavage/methylation domain-containing protein
MRARDPDKGFSLIEMMVTIFILSLLLSSILFPLISQIDQRRISETERRLELVKEALIGYALTHRNLPCPAKSSTDGTEDRISGGTTCRLVSGVPVRVGFLPWVTLGLEPADTWDNLFRYSVSPSHSNSDPAARFTLDDLGDITIRTRNNAGTAVDMSNASIPVVILSHGKNGYGATTRGGAARFTPGGWVGDERDNANNSNIFYWRVRTERTTAAGGEFDDIVAWITPDILNSKMVAAGRLP